MQIKVDEETKVISVGKAEYHSFHIFKSSYDFADNVLFNNDIRIDFDKFDTRLKVKRLAAFDLEVKEGKAKAEDLRAYNKAIADALGCSRTQFCKHFNKLMLKTHVAPVFHLYKKIKPWTLKGGSSWNTHYLKLTNNYKNILEEVYADGLYNIMPIIAITGKTPKELKAALKNKWKIVANNSLNKNKAIADYLYNVYFTHGNDGRTLVLKNICHLPTSVFKYKYTYEVLSYIAKNFKGVWNKRQGIQQEVNYFCDTRNMLLQLNREFNADWTPRRMKEEHNKASKEIAMKDASPVPFNFIPEGFPREVELDEFKATLLDSTYLIALEGIEMSHCVGGYKHYAAEDRYAVWSVTKNGERYSTIGFEKARRIFNNGGSHVVDSEDQWFIQQHYKAFNQPVDDDKAKQLATDVMLKVNNFLKHQRDSTKYLTVALKNDQ